MKDNQIITKGGILKYNTGINIAAKEITGSAKA